MDVVLIIGRVLYALIFIGSGMAGHLMAAGDTAAYAESRGVSNAKLLTQISGVLILAGGLGVALGILPDLAALGLAAYALITGVMVHHFWSDEDPMLRQVEMSMFMKNLALVGGGLIIFAVSAGGGDIGPTITDPIFNL